MQPNFEKMTRQELRAYILEHREDDEAFYIYTKNGSFLDFCLGKKTLPVTSSAILKVKRQTVQSICR